MWRARHLPTARQAHPASSREGGRNAFAHSRGGYPCRPGPVQPPGCRAGSRSSPRALPGASVTESMSDPVFEMQQSKEIDAKRAAMRSRSARSPPPRAVMARSSSAGRMLRAALWRWKGDLRFATRITAGIGSGFGLFLRCQVWTAGFRVRVDAVAALLHLFTDDVQDGGVIEVAARPGARGGPPAPRTRYRRGTGRRGRPRLLLPVVEPPAEHAAHQQQVLARGLRPLPERRRPQDQPGEARRRFPHPPRRPAARSGR